jgi:hypothetical protein
MRRACRPTRLHAPLFAGAFQAALDAGGSDFARRSLLPNERVSERLLEKKKTRLTPSGTVEDALVFRDEKLELDSRQRQKGHLTDARDHGGVDEEARLDKFA